MPHPFKRVSILLVCHSYPPVLGGSEIEAQRVSLGLIERGHRVRVLCAGGAPMPAVYDWIDPAGVPVNILTRHSGGRWKDLVFALAVAWNIWRRKGDYDIVYFLMQGLHLATGLPVSRFLGKPVLMKISGDGIVSTMRRSRAGRLELGWLRQWDVPLMLLNENMFQEAIADGFPRQQLIWMPNPVDIDEFRPAQAGEAAAWRERHGIPEKALLAIYTGRLSQEKGLVELLRGFAVMAPAVPDALLVLLGDGPTRKELEDLVRELNLADRVRFVGRVPLTEVPMWLRASDVFALTSPNEGFSCSLLEAMASGLPSVVSNIPANLQLVDEGVHGMAVSLNDEQAIGQALIRLAGHPDLRLRMGRAARDRVTENYSTARVVERYDALFGAVMNHEKPQPVSPPGT